MAKFKIRYFTERKNTDGSKCYRWRPPAYLHALGFKDDKRLDNDWATAVRQAQELNALVDAVRAGQAPAPVTPVAIVPHENHVPSGTVEDLCNRFLASRDYQELTPRGQETARLHLRKIKNEMGAEPLADVDVDDCLEWYETLQDTGKLSMAFYTIKAARRLWKWARKVKDLRDLLPPGGNPWEVCELKEPTPGKALLWSMDMVMHFVNAADALKRSSIGTAVILNHWIGQRPADLRKIEWTHYRDGRFYVTQNKTGTEVVVGHSPLIVKRLDWAQKRKHAISTTIVVNENTGKPYSADAFEDAFNDVLALAIAGDAALGIEPCPALVGAKFRWLRHTAVTRMSEAGATVQHISAVSGHSLKTVQTILEKYLTKTVALADAGLALRLANDPLHRGDWLALDDEPLALPAPQAAAA